MNDDFNPTPVIATGVLLLAVIAGGGLYGCPQYAVYSAEMDGKAKFARANQDREIMVRQATAERDAAKFKAEAEVERAKGVAAANKIIGDSLKDNEEYLRWLWVEGLKEGKDGNTVVYIPTEANMPILESGRLNKGKK